MFENTLFIFYPQNRQCIQSTSQSRLQRIIRFSHCIGMRFLNFDATMNSVLYNGFQGLYHKNCIVLPECAYINLIKWKQNYGWISWSRITDLRTNGLTVKSCLRFVIWSIWVHLLSYQLHSSNTKFLEYSSQLHSDASSHVH